MSSVDFLRDFVSERLTAAAEEIFSVFQKTIVEYEEEVLRQRRLLEIVCKPEIQLHRTELPQQYFCKEEEEEEVVVQQLFIRGSGSSLDQEDPEPPPTKGEQEELCTGQDVQQLVLEQETDNFVLTRTCEDSDHSEPETNSDQQLLHDNPLVAESRVQKGGKNGDSTSSRNAKPRKRVQHRASNSHSNNANDPTLLGIHSHTDTTKALFQCDPCGKAFKFKSQLCLHMRTHTDERPYSCKTCGKDFRSNSHLTVHMKTHTGEKPYSCNFCGKGFIQTSALNNHLRIHTGDKPYTCEICGKGFKWSGGLNFHMKMHTGERPHTCQTCGKEFRQKSDLTVHVRRSHTGEKPYLCKICGKRHFSASDLAKHIRSHTGKQPRISFGNKDFSKPS